MNLSFRLKSGLFILINYIILSTLFCNVKTTLFCDENFPGDLRQFCEKMEAGKNNTRDPNLPQGGRDLPDDRKELRCVTLSCFCPALNGKKDGTVNGCKLPNGNKLGKCIRYEMRMLTDEQRQAYVNYKLN
ncbi:unnamed protein product [Meloidogyne enterolobii]|uniref:Uncharacterized protein n=1 Tax=Meloidogyne enterolobii TaxID=390850 RepID=A0ACB1AL20_MELEN